ncbi:hypothetical protein [Rossellomorea marisflavi]|uniref:hypothetical protein n=1 Tax=Rossellomorea marisflavi TaxID=189381 RepID=UPI0015C4A3C9|nr:hypothetical protein [Rossellomorea marisflavi]
MDQRQEIQLDVSGMLDTLASRIGQLEKEKAVLIAQLTQLQSQLDGGTEAKHDGRGEA